MAKFGKNGFVFKITADTSEALSEVKNLLADVARLTEDDGQLIVNAVINDDQIVNFDKLFEKISEKGKNALSVVFDQDVTRTMLGGTPEEISATLSKMIEYLRQYGNIQSNVFGIDNTAYFEKQEKAIAKLEERLKSLNEQAYGSKEKNLQDALVTYGQEAAKKQKNKSYIISPQVLAKLKASFDILKTDKDFKKNGVDLVSKDGKTSHIPFQQLSETINKLKVDNDIYKEYFSEFTSANKANDELIKYVKQAINKKNGITDKALDSILSDDYDIKTIAENAKKNVDAGIRYGGGNGDGSGGGSATVGVSPANLDEFSEKITEYTKVNKVKVYVEPEVADGFVLKIGDASIENATTSSVDNDNGLNDQLSTEDLKAFYKEQYELFKAKNDNTSLKDETRKVYESGDWRNDHKLLAKLLAIGNAYKDIDAEYWSKQGDVPSDKITTQLFDGVIQNLGLSVDEVSSTLLSFAKKVGVDFYQNGTNLVGGAAPKKEQLDVEVGFSFQEGSLSKLKSDIETAINPIEIEVKLKDIKNNEDISDSIIDTQAIEEKQTRLKELQEIIDAVPKDVLSSPSPYPGMRDGFKSSELDQMGFTKPSVVKQQIKQYRELLKNKADASDLQNQLIKVARYIYASNDSPSYFMAKEDVKSGLASQLDDIFVKIKAAREAVYERSAIREEIAAMENTPATPKDNKHGDLHIEFTTNIDKINTDIQELKDKSPIDIEVNFVEAENSISSLVSKVKSAFDDVEINPKLAKGFTINASDIQIGGSECGVSNLGKILRGFSEASKIMERGRDASSVERSLFFNISEGFVDNPYVVGDSGSVGYYLKQRQLKHAVSKGRQVNSHLHTHPYANTDIVEPSPSGNINQKYRYSLEGDVGAFANDIKDGIVHQFIATTERLLHINYDGISEEVAAKIGTKYARQKKDVEANVANEYSRRYFSYYDKAINHNKQLITQRIEQTLSNIQGKDSSVDFSNLSKIVYDALKIQINDAAAQTPYKQSYNVASIFDMDNIKKMLPYNISDELINEINNFVTNSLQSILMGNDAYNNVYFADSSKMLRDIFIEKGFGADRVQSFDLEEGIKHFGWDSAGDNEFTGNVSNFKFTPDTKLVWDEIQRLKEEDPITINVKFLPKREDLDVEINNIKNMETLPIPITFKPLSDKGKQAVEDYKTAVNGISPAFDDIKKGVVDSAAQDMVKSIKSVTSAVKDLITELSKIGVGKVKDLEKLQSEATKALAQSEKNKQILEKTERERLKTEEQRKKTEKASAQAVKATKEMQDTIAGKKSGRGQKKSDEEIDLEKLEKRYEKLVEPLNKEKLISDSYLTDLMTQADDYMTKLKNGTAANDKEAEEWAQELTGILDIIKKINVESYKLDSDKSGKFEHLISDKKISDYADKKELESYLQAQLFSGKDYQNVSFGKFTTGLGDITKVKVSYKFKDSVVEQVLALNNLEMQSGETAIAIRTLKTTEDEYVGVGQKWISGVKAKIASLTQYVTGMELVMKAWNAARQGFSFVKELDASMTTIYQTMDITREGLESLSSQAIETAQNLGAVSDQMISSVNIYAAYGKTVDEIISQATPTVMLANAIQGDAEAASEFIQGVVQQYSELEGQETRIVNTFEKLGSQVQIDFPKAVQSIAEGVQTAGSVMREAGVDFELFGASMAKVSETTRLEGTQIANAMKTIASRISRSKSGDDEVTSEDRSNAAKAYGSVGISVYNDDGSYRGLANILDELSEKWDTLSDAQKAYVAEQSAGVRNINVFNTMLDTWEEARQLAVEAVEDSEYYLEVQEKHMESMTAKINTFKATLEEFWYNLIDTGAINLLIETGTVLIDVLGGIVKGFQSIGEMAGGEVGGALGGIAGAATTVLTGASLWESFNKKLKGEDGKEHRGGFKNIWSDIKTLFGEGGKKVDAFKTAFDSAGQSAQGFAGKLQGVKDGSLAVWSSLTKTSKVLLGLGAATLVLAAINWGFNEFTDTTEEVAEAAKKARDEFEASQASLKSNRQTINKIGYDYQILSKGVNEFGENISLTSDEFNKYKDICNQIADMYPHLVKSYDEQGNAILNLKGKVAELNEEYEKQRLNEAYANANNLDTYATDFANRAGHRDGWTKFADSVTDWGKTDVGGKYTEADAINVLRKIQSMSVDDFNAYMYDLKLKSLNDVNFGKEYSYILSDELLDVEWYKDFENLTAEEFAALQTKVTGNINKYQGTIDDSAVNLKSSMQSLLLTMQLDKSVYPQFQNIDESVFDNLSHLISNMTSDQINAIGEDAEDFNKAYREYVSKLVDAVDDNHEAQDALAKLFSITGETSLEDIDSIIGVAEDGINSAIEILAKALDEDANQLRIKFGFEDEAELLNKADEMLDSIVGHYNESFENADIFDVEEAKDRMDELEKLFNTYQKNRGIGSNVDYSKRPIKTAEDMFAAGWNRDWDKENLAGNPVVTMYNSSVYGKDLYNALEKHKDIRIEITPILENGEVLSPGALNDYVDYLFSQDDILAADSDATHGKNLVVSLFNDPSDEFIDQYYEVIDEIKGQHAELVEYMDEYDDLMKSSTKRGKTSNKLTKQELAYRRRVRNFMKEQNINTADEITLLQRCVETTDSWAEAVRKFSLTNVDLNLNDEIIAGLDANLDLVEAAIENIDEAIESSNGTMGLTKEQIENIKSAFSDLGDEFDYDQLFESTAEGVRLNAQELDRLNGLYENMQRNKYDEQLENLEQQYSNLCIAIGEANTATERSELINKRNGVLQQIQQVQELKSRYEGLTNAVTKYFRAKEAGEDGDTYVGLVDEMEEIEQLYNRGLVGTNQWQAAVQMMTNEDLSGASIEKYMQVWDEKWAQFKSWMTEDATGIQTFLYDAMNMLNDPNKIRVDENGFWHINASIEEMAEGLGVSQAVIQEIFKRLKDYGFDVDFEEATDHLKKLREEAELARDAVEEGYQLNLEADGDELFKEIERGEKLLEDYGKRLEEMGIDPTTVDGYNNLSKQLDYVYAKAGKTADAMNFELNYADNKDEIDSLIEKFKTIDEYKDIYINFENVNISNVESQIDTLMAELEKFRDPATGKLDLSSENAQVLFDLLVALNNQKIALTNTSAILKLDANNFKDEQYEAISLVQTLKSNMDEIAAMEFQASMGATIDENKLAALKDDVDGALASIQNDITTKGTDSIYMKLGLTASTEEDFQTQLNGIDANKLVECQFTLTDEEKEKLGYIEADVTKKVDIDDTVAWEKLKTLEDEIKKKKTLTFEAPTIDTIIAKWNSVKSKTETLTINEVRNVHTNYTNSSISSGGASKGGAVRVNGTAYVYGTAYAGGNWGLKQNETALVGELGKELVVDPSTGTWNLVGEHGAEFRDLKRGQIVFNHKQTEEIFKNGYVTSGGGRGKALVEGTIGKLNSLFKVGSGSAYAAGVSGKFTTNGALAGSNKFYNNALTWGDDDADDFKDAVDWIEVWLDRIQRKIEELDTIASSAFKSFSKRGEALADQYAAVTEEIRRQQAAYKKYMQYADQVSLSASYKEKVRNGTLQIEKITDEDLKEKIDEYQELYEKALDCKQAVVDLNEQLGEIVKTNFDNIVDEFDALLNRIESVTDATEKALDIVEAKGNFASKTYYESLIATEQENLAMLREEYSALQEAFDEAMKTGHIEEGSSAYYEMQEQIREVESAIQDAMLSMIEFKNEMWENDWSIFEKAIQYIEEITKESDFLVDLLSLNENDLFSKKSGKLNDYGMSVGGLHAMDYNVHMANAQAYAKEIEKINKELAKDPYNTILLDKKYEYIQAQQDSIKAANNEKMAIRDLIEESYNRMLEILQKLINKRKDLLQAEKNLYDYERNIADQTKNITSLRKQLIALEGDQNEETQARRQTLQDQLESAEKDLEATEYDQWLTDQEKLLADLYTDYEEVLNERLDNIDGLMSEMIDSANQNAEMINQTITGAADKVGYDITEGMSGIWNNSDSGLGKVVTDFGANFTSAMTTANDYVRKIYEYISGTVAKSETEKATNTSPAKNPSSTTTTQSANKSTSSSSSNSSTSNNSNSPFKHNFFKYLKNEYPRDGLNISESVIDRMKYNNINPDFNLMKSYYAGMNLGSASDYVGSFEQNVAMLNWLKSNGYSSGGTIGKLIHRAGEDGFVLAKEGEHILNREQLSLASNMVSELINFAKFTPNVGAIKGMSYAHNGNNVFNFNLPNVKDEQSFLKEIQTNKQVQQALISATLGKAMGKNTFDVNRFK